MQDSLKPGEKPDEQLGRNEPCFCGSGKKFKRCHGVGAAPKLSAPATPPAGGAPGGMPGGFDPSKMDPQMMAQFAQAMQRLPKGQLQRLQGLMQKAMSGKDITREAEEFERTMPVELQSMMKTFAGSMAAQMGGAGGMAGAPSAPATDTLPGDMTAEEARKIVAAAAAEGKISKDQADQLLSGTEDSIQKKSGFSKLWRGITGKES